MTTKRELFFPEQYPKKVDEKAKQTKHEKSKREVEGIQ